MMKNSVRLISIFVSQVNMYSSEMVSRNLFNVPHHALAAWHRRCKHVTNPVEWTCEFAHQKDFCFFHLFFQQSTWEKSHGGWMDSPGPKGSWPPGDRLNMVFSGIAPEAVKNESFCRRIIKKNCWPHSGPHMSQLKNMRNPGFLHITSSNVVLTWLQHDWQSGSCIQVNMAEYEHGSQHVQTRLAKCDQNLLRMPLLLRSSGVTINSY